MTRLNKIALNVFLLLILTAVWHVEAQAANDGRIRLGITIYANGSNGLTEEDALLMTNKLTDGLAGTKNIRLYERRQLEEALRELRRGGSLAMDQNTVMRLGKIAGLQYVLVGSISALAKKEHTGSVNATPLYNTGVVKDKKVTLVQGNQTTIAERYEVNVRMLDVATGEVRLSVSEEKSASASNTGTKLFSSKQKVEPGELRRRAINGAMTSLTKKIRDALTKEFASLPNPSPVGGLPTPQKQIATDVSQPIQSQKTDFDPNVSNQAKVIQTYSIDSGQRNLLTVGHNAAYQKYRKGDFKAAYEAFNRLVDQYSGNYLAAYWAGESASKRGNRYKPDALECYNKALEINPDYVPAQNAKKRL